MKDEWDGKKLPNVSLESNSTGKLKLPDDILGKWTLLYFYPKDDTPGCTIQACGYRDQIQQFKDTKISIYGISSDDLGSHNEFSKKFDLNFPLLSDPKQELSSALGVYGKQEWKGNTFLGLSRDSFFIDPDGTIKKVWRRVDPQTTIDETLAEAKKIIEDSK